MPPREALLLVEAPPDAFGNVAAEYERGRPEWPDELIDRVLDELALPRDATVLDLGAGTGKLTRSLVARFDRVLAVEPDDEMRAVLAQVVPGAEALPGDAAAVPLADRSVDAVFSAEAFHWFATRETLAEIARVLRARGALVIFWNIFEGQMVPRLSGEVRAALDGAFRRGGAPGQHRVLSGEWRRPFEGSKFEPLREDALERELATDRETWIANLLSVSSIASQPPAARAALAERLRRLAPDCEYRRKVKTLAYWTRLA